MTKNEGGKCAQLTLLWNDTISLNYKHDSKGIF